MKSPGVMPGAFGPRSSLVVHRIRHARKMAGGFVSAQGGKAYGSEEKKEKEYSFQTVEKV
jgi:hypothetical protein